MLVFGCRSEERRGLPPLRTAIYADATIRNGAREKGLDARRRAKRSIIHIMSFSYSSRRWRQRRRRCRRERFWRRRERRRRHFYGLLFFRPEHD